MSRCKPTFISAKQLRATRQSLGMTRKQLAAICRVSHRTIERMEKVDMGAQVNQDSDLIHIPPFSPLRVLHKIIALAPHLLARRAKPDWTL